MPTPEAIALDSFIDKYKEYCNYSQFASDWTNNIIAIVPLLQADPNYATALTVEEQAAMTANLLAAQSSKIIPIPINRPNAISDMPK